MERGKGGERKVPPRHCLNPVFVSVDAAGNEAATVGASAGGGERNLTSHTHTDRPMLGFRLFFPSPMQKEICSEASPSSVPVYWGFAWAPA